MDISFSFIIYFILVLNSVNVNIGQNNSGKVSFVKNKYGNVQTNNAQNDYEYENSEEYVQEYGNRPSFIDKWRELYEQGKNVSSVKNVENINQTFDILNTFGKNMKYLFIGPNDSQEKQKAIEFLMEIDLGITNQCYSALIKLIKAMGDRQMWALKCK